MTISPRGLASTSADYGGVLCFLVFALALALASPLSASPLRGISPRDEKYFMGPVIACRDGSATFPKDRLNDGFCDCPDGTDEPGTSACPESKFYCRNMGDAPRFLFSSRVNDHICDCCDGSDEYESGVQCPNTCHKDQNASENSTVTVNPESNGLDDLNRQSRNTRIDLIENLIKNIRELMAVIAMQMIVCAIVMIVFCCHHYRHNRIRRKGYFLSRSRGGATTISSLVVASLNAFGATASCLISCHENPSFVLSFLYISR